MMCLVDQTTKYMYWLIIPMSFVQSTILKFFSPPLNFLLPQDRRHLPEATLWYSWSPVDDLQSRPMNDLVVNNQLSSSVVDDQSPDTSPAVGKGTVDLAVQSTLVNDG